MSNIFEQLDKKTAALLAATKEARAAGVPEEKIDEAIRAGTARAKNGLDKIEEVLRKAAPPPRCSPKGWCEAMGRSLNETANAHLKGLSVTVVTSIETGESRTIGVAYRNCASDRGVMLNTCPWCGAPILWVDDSPVLEGAYIPQKLAAELIAMLEISGFGKQGTSNTLWGMVHEALLSHEQLSEIVSAVARRVVKVERWPETGEWRVYCNACGETWTCEGTGESEPPNTHPPHDDCPLAGVKVA